MVPISSATAPADPISTAQHARLFHALSDVRRLQILDALRGGEQCVCDLQADVGFAQSLLSFHLKTLRVAGLVTVRRSGRWAHYSVSADALEHARAVLTRLEQPAQREPGDCCSTPSATDRR